MGSASFPNAETPHFRSRKLARVERVFGMVFPRFSAFLVPFPFSWFPGVLVSFPRFSWSLFPGFILSRLPGFLVSRSPGFLGFACLLLLWSPNFLLIY